MREQLSRILLLQADKMLLRGDMRVN